MAVRVDPDGAVAVQQQFLAFFRRGLQQHLILVIMLEPVGVFPIAAIRRAAAGLHISGFPGGAAQRPQRGVGGQRARTNFLIIGLKNGAPLF